VFKSIGVRTLQRPCVGSHLFFNRKGLQRNRGYKSFVSESFDAVPQMKHAETIIDLSQEFEDSVDLS